ncbi:glycerol-3-phosphate 1-O-acyltransferase PlsY [Pontibaca methylaminivorans]|uniref:Glycerol-3-phosphate acyltransferase n=1 Tax=Pontibaca methylaminivorans TaxID=515897 RepID=A0A1R3WU51_9RHOB|nr:glycerol-3-phosphate 1-O-acyltransferase PlsY [Pontibaca methylaminivorans]SIT81522.1 acyl-phosphate glycerol-3-phosphate acyltransferase [Pontibaca methylaminivorans]
MPVMDATLLQLILWGLIAYGLGSVPFGLLLTRMLGLGNLRAIGSGNTGATNVLRTGSKGAAAATLLLDAAKGTVAVWLAAAFAGEAAAQLAALAALVGHCWPVWARFRGGKGVATFIGVWLALSWPVGVVCCATWLVTVLIARISSLGALAMVVASPLWVLLLGPGDMFLLSLLLAALVVGRHHANIARLAAGTEPRIGR